jgi:FMN-dependent oxidoreductase (nitrilotriacetate monooxygenase family)
MRELVLGAFEELTPSFVSNAWHLERGDTRDFATLPFWLDLARELEAGGFDFLFLAEALGYPMREDGSVPETVFREAVQFPVHDPLAIVSGLAAVTSRLGFVVTASTTSQHPYLNARAFTTLDHLTGGRIGWNIVTTDQQAALVRLLGQSEVTPHDERYRRASEFLDLSLKLWEGSWDDDAVVADKARRIYADPAKVHRVQHQGEYFRLDGYFPAIPSVQRTPTLFQAGTSDAGTTFASRYAECVFTAFQDVDRGARAVAGLRAKAVAEGRGASAVKVINGVSIVVGDTAAEAEEQRRELDAAPSPEAAAVLFMAWSGVDLTTIDPATPTSELSTEIGQSNIEMWANNPLTPTVGDVLRALPSRAGGVKVTGTADQVTAELLAIAERADLDGFLVEHTWGGIESYRVVLDEVVPRLRAAGALPATPRSGTLREMLTDAQQPTLPDTHTGASYRHR